MRRRTLLFYGAAGVIVAATGASMWRSGNAQANLARARLRGRSEVFQSRFGTMEYAVAGDGPPVLMIHGTGGGFDQGLAFSSRLIEAGWQIVAPSRFGYLRTDFPADPSSENQADAFVDLLDLLGIERVPAIGGSAGALSAIQFALRHPDRCSALVAVVPATHVPGRPPVRPGWIGQAIIEHGLRSDFLFWMGARWAEDRMISTLLATDPALVAAASPRERARVRAILRNIMPVSERAEGLLNDAQLAGNPAPMALEDITVPTLALSVEDDRFGTAEAARHIAATVPGARLVMYPQGGHVWVGHDEEVFGEIDAFLKEVQGLA